MAEPRHVVRVDWDCPHCPWAVCTEVVIFAESDVELISSWVDILIDRHIAAHGAFVSDMLENVTPNDLIEYWNREKSDD